MSGYYTFVSNSSIDTYGYLYNDTFDPYNPTLNLLQRNDDSVGNAQFLINVSLVNTGSYCLGCYDILSKQNSIVLSHRI